MLQLLIMPVESYNTLIDGCRDSCPEYELLKNGFIIRNEQGEQEFRVACENARPIIDFAAKNCAAVVPSMSIVRPMADAVFSPDSGKSRIHGYPKRSAA